jgi:hypothetical protein
LFGVSGNTDDGEPNGLIVKASIECDSLADGTNARPINVSSTLVDDDYTRGSRVVGRSYIATAEEGQAHSLEVTRRNKTINGTRQFTWARPRASFDEKVPTPDIAGERQMVNTSRSHNARDLADGLQ